MLKATILRYPVIPTGLNYLTKRCWMDFSLGLLEVGEVLTLGNCPIALKQSFAFLIRQP